MSRCFACIAFSLCLLLSFGVPTHAQNADSQLWTMLVLNKRYKSGLRLYGEIQPRLGTDYSRTSQLLIRSAVGYQISGNFSAWIGYGWTPSFSPEFNNEDRWFGQLLWEDKIGTYRMINRTRLEIRSISGVGEESIRLRHQTRLSKPLVDKSPWIGIFSNELFWNINNTALGPEGGFDQYRVFFGVGYNVNKTVRTELGYQATFLNRARTPDDLRQDILLLTFSIDL